MGDNNLKKTILIYDDESINLEILKIKIEQRFHNYHVKIFEKFDGFPDLTNVDIILFDYFFSHKHTTPSLIKEAKLINPNIFIIAMSGMFVFNGKHYKCYNNSIMKECINSGANRICTKNTDDLIDMIHKHFAISLIKNS